MNVLRVLCKNFVIVVMVLLEVTTALPQWRNSTDGRQYFIEGNVKYNWFQAQHQCARRNLQLVEIDTEAKNLPLVELLKFHYGNSSDFWLGANDEFNRDKNDDRPFFWSATGRRMNYTYWADGNYRNGGHCVHTWANATNFHWSDGRCDFTYFGYICEKQSPLVTTYNPDVEEQKITIKHMMENLWRDFREQHQLQMDQLANAYNTTLAREADLVETFHSMQKKFKYDLNHEMAQHQWRMDSVMEDRKHLILSLNWGVHNATEWMHKKFYKQLEAVNQMVNELSGI